MGAFFIYATISDCHGSNKYLYQKTSYNSSKDKFNTQGNMEPWQTVIS